MSQSFVHLHTHTDYSMLDGAARLKPLMEAVVADNQPAIAITDHGNMFGAFDFYKQARAHGLNPIIGIEAYMTPGTQARQVKSPVLFASGGPDDVSAAGAYTHMTMWAETTEGMHNLFRISSRSWLDGFYKKPRGDRDLLVEYGKGVIATTGCPSGEVQTYLRLGMFDKAVQAAADFRDILGEGNFFVELMDHDLAIERRVRDDLLRLASHLGLPLVATNDLHYVSRDQAEAHDSLLCINSGSRLADADRFRFDNDTYYLRSADEMRLLFANLTQACDNTLAIAERCRVEFDEGANLMPQFDVPDGETEETWFVKEVQSGLARRYPNGIPAASQQRADYEVDVIRGKGYCGYYLVVADFIQWAKSQGIRVGPGRGSGAGSMAAYAMRITDLDPIEHDLLFERFLNPERMSMPDFDIDFDERRRGEVIQYVTDKYGQDRVSQIVTMQTIKARAAIKDSVRIHGLPYDLGEKANKQYPADIMGKGMPLAGLYDTSHPRYVEGADFREFAEKNVEMPTVLRTAQGVEGLKRTTGVHAAGVIMSKARLIDHIPIMLRPDDGAIITQFENEWCESLGLVKMDFLGLSNLTIIDDAVKNIEQNRGVKIDLDTLPLDDAATYRTLANGEGIGVFQCESGGIRALLRRIAPTEFKHLDATLALYRPGPMGANAHLDYADRKNGRQQVTPIHPELAKPLEQALGSTYGLIVYQEQVMEIAQILAGYSLGQADLLRRAMGKKKKEVLDREFEPFRDGMLANGYSQDAIDTLWAILVPFSDYAFNKAHTAAYGLISYWTAWLKTHYPVEYMAALLTGAKGKRGDAAIFLAEARRMKINLAVPDVNESIGPYSAVGDTIRVGLSAVVNISDASAAAIVAERTRNGPFSDFLDFVQRVDVKAAGLDSLIRAGAFDFTGHPRRALASVADAALQTAAGLKKARAIGQDDLFADLDDDTAAGDVTVLIPQVDEWPRRTLLGLEREQIGLYVSDHPLRPVAGNLAALGTHRLADLHASNETGHKVTIAGGLASVDKKVSKKGQSWAALTLEDLDTSIEVLCFPRTYEIVAEHLLVDAIVTIHGRVDREEDGTAKIIAETVQTPELEEDGSQPIYLHCRIQDITAANVDHIKVVASTNPGNRPLRLRVLHTSGEITTYALPPEFRIAVNDRTMSEFKEVFGAGCFDAGPSEALAGA